MHDKISEKHTNVKRFKIATDQTWVHINYVYVNIKKCIHMLTIPKYIYILYMCKYTQGLCTCIEFHFNSKDENDVSFLLSSSISL